jgi:hypothetical protein
MVRSVLSLAACRKLLRKEDRDISDGELERLRDHLTAFAAILLDFALSAPNPLAGASHGPNRLQKKPRIDTKHAATPHDSQRADRHKQART